MHIYIIRLSIYVEQQTFAVFLVVLVIKSKRSVMFSNWNLITERKQQLSLVSGGEARPMALK
jgi:hypothetical protein